MKAIKQVGQELSMPHVKTIFWSASQKDDTHLLQIQMSNKVKLSNFKRIWNHTDEKQKECFHNTGPQLKYPGFKNQDID